MKAQIKPTRPSSSQATPKSSLASSAIMTPEDAAETQGELA